VRVEPGQREVEINYTAPGFEAEHTRFRYMLEGLHRGWVDAGTRRSVHYAHLPPGTFTFRVQAAGSEAGWSEAAAAVRLAVRPAFYQTIWFSAAVLIAMVLAGVGISTLRVRRLQEAERRLTARIGEATAELASANRRLEQLATIDELTQLANRRRFSETIDHEWQRALRQATPLGLLMLDVDFFKRYNDTHGHQAGDACLQQVAAVLASRPKRASDLAARYGGEEFAVVLPETGEDGALTVAEWIRAEVERQGLPHGASPVAEVVTVSVGAAVVMPAPGMAAASLVAAADAALYRAKESGRNTVVAGTMETPPDAGAAATRFSGMRIHHPGS
jgi:diguanylate cyclase (GGDEF)-like protein